MTSTNFMIGPVTEGLRKDLRPYAIPEDAYEVLNNASEYLGKIERRPGNETLGRLSTDGGTTFLGLPVMGLRTRELFANNQQALIAFDTQKAYSFNGAAFSLLSSVQTVTWSGTNYNLFYTTNYAGALWTTNSKPGLQGADIKTVTVGAVTTIETTGNHNFTSGQTVTFINVQGVTGINGQQGLITVTSNTTFTVPISTAGVHTANTGFALNSMVSLPGKDGIRYYASTGVGDTWVNYNPPISETTALAGALLIFAYRGYLVFLNTTEGSSNTTLQNYGNRARWTQIGTPFYSDPVPNVPSLQTVDVTTARDDLFGKGGANDAPTSEVIIGASFIRDVLIVYFERSTWRLRFVNNAQNPFVWERVNIEYGSNSTFSCIPFDKGLMTIGDRGIVISDGNDTIRVDEKIPEDIFNIRQTNNGYERIFGIRTFRKRTIYWAIPTDSNPDGIFPNRVLAFNYNSKNWSYFDDSYTCFGYYYPSQAAETWGSMTNPWSWYDETWDSGIASEGEETIIAGNQQGYVQMLEQNGSQNGPSLCLNSVAGSVLTSTNHNLEDGTWISLSSVSGITSSDGVSLNGRNFKVANPGNDASTFSLTEFKPIAAPNAVGSTYTYDVDYTPIIPGSVQINVGSYVFYDRQLDGTLTATGASGTIDYNTGVITLNFDVPILSTPVNIRVVSYNELQQIVPVTLSGVYVANSGQIRVISNFNVQTKIFNFFKDNKRARLSKIDFYTDVTENGQFTCNVFSDSTNLPANQPLSDNLQSNVVLTSNNPYQFGEGQETIYRLFCDCVAQTLQIQMTLSDRQMAVNEINESDFKLIAMMVNMRRGGRLV